MAATKNRRRSARLPPPPARPTAGSALVESWRSLPASLAVLRAFLGLTFLYAGVQKLLDPNFLRAGSPDYIGTQLHGFAQGSPIGWLLGALAHIPVLTGIGIAVAEIGVGVGTLVGVAPRTMAAAGFLVNLTLLLSATWHVHPYFLGSDSIYAVAWAAYLIGLGERSRRTIGERAETRPSRARHARGSVIGRREVLRGATLAGATLAGAATAKALSGTPAAATLAADQATAPSVSGPPATAGSGAGGGGAGGGAPVSGPGTAGVQGTPVTPLSKIPVGGAIGFQDPGGGPAALVRLSQNEVVAYSRVCTHAGCLVGYDTNQHILYCPCHGAEFDPARGAAVIGGPAPRPLDRIPVRIDRATGEVVVPN